MLTCNPGAAVSPSGSLTRSGFRTPSEARLRLQHRWFLWFEYRVEARTEIDSAQLSSQLASRDASALSKLNSWRLLKLIKIKSARSRLYRSQILQVNTRWKALAEIYTMHSFAPLSDLKISVKNCWIFCCFFPKSRKFCPNFAKFLLNFRQS